ncbi:hypothetical protein [Micromonospora carbonacea]|uniref:Uncharacterized protein n=1 Tax=Micromonospora carbonacea TaxID=47853 RepID=A0A1C5AC08_9ACTN|nr:hypothetical protein [Micromonospora carbonacea]SCF42778.1 hypothetical protein GA0070563_112129 [Micromonospora carbonacea]
MPESVLRRLTALESAVAALILAVHGTSRRQEPVSQQPSVGRIVHYVSYGTPGGEYTSQCRAAIVAGVPVGALPVADPDRAEEWDSDAVVVDLVVLNPTGLFFNRCPQSEDNHQGGTWHWPERV